jgi:hypothetical protein
MTGTFVSIKITHGRALQECIGLSTALIVVEAGGYRSMVLVAR